MSSEQLEHMCIRNLEELLGRTNAPRILTGRTPFQERLESLRARLSEFQQHCPENLFGNNLAKAGSGCLSMQFPALFAVAGEAQGYATVPCEFQRSVVRELFHNFRDAYMSYQFLATRYFARHYFGGLPLQHPSLEIGTDDGVTAKLAFGGRQLTVGSNPSLPELLQAARLGTHKHYLSLDSNCIPFRAETFQSVVMIYTFYHLTDRERAIREVGRILAPGGVFAFMDTTQFVEEWLPLSNILESCGFTTLAREFKDQWFSRYDSNRQYLTEADYRTLLGNADLDVIAVHPFYSQSLIYFTYFGYLFDNLFETRSVLNTGTREIEAIHLRILDEVLCPMLALDERRCLDEKQSAYRFVVARKRGGPTPPIAEGKILDYLRCPRDGAELEKGMGCLRSRTTGVEYPVVEDVPLLIPFYADWLKRRGRPPRG